MDENKRIQSVPLVYNQASISLPLDENAFKEFMVSLLGQPESIEGYVEGAFEIDIGSFEYLNNLIDDRIAKQNLSSLLEFRAKLFFNDGSSISFNGVQNFINYKELRPLICEGFIFTWSYLVKFHNRQASEKQEISISSVDDSKTRRNKSNRRNRSLFSGFDLSSSHKPPKISYSIRCTDKGWGIEITELVRRFLSSLTKASPSLGNALRQKIVERFKLVEFSCLGLAYVTFFILVFQVSEVPMQECRNLSGQGIQYIENNLSIDQKIDFLIQIVSACNARSLSFASFIIPMLSLAAGSLLLPPLIYNLVKLPDYRFLLFTETSKKERDEFFHKMKDRKTFWIITVLMALIIGILGNYIFTWLTTILR
ncbi:hypothetical protein C7B76_10330 [filamentous cyanobacterium CCP2]|nr:hypothetical protein C7B76_10330 [filamentous cyanobacterium CCP2]